MSKKHLPVYVPIGLAAVFLVGVALVAVMLLKSCREDDVAYWGPMQEATDDTFYKGLPLGGLALSHYLADVQAPDRHDRVLRAYTAGRLAVSPRVYKDTATTKRFAQAVRLPYEQEAPQPLLPAECGYYNGPCVLVFGDEVYWDESSFRIISDVTGFEGYKPLKFIDDDTVLLSGSFADGHCGSMGYKAIDFSSGSSTRSLYQLICFSGGYDILFQIDDTEVAALKVRIQNPAEDILEAKAFIIDFMEGEKVLRTLRNVVPPQNRESGEGSFPFDWIRADVDAYFANPSELRVLIGDSVYTFPVPADTEASQSPR